MNRRRFLQTGAALAGSVAAPRAVAAEAGRPIRVGFLGVAYSHAAEKVRILRQSEEYDLIGVWAENRRLEERYTGQGVRVMSRREVLDGADVVVVESEVPTHADLAREALEAGRHVHLEKPPALTLKAFDELVGLARARRRLLQVGYMWRHNPGLNTVLEAARKGWLGDVFLVRATLNNQLDAARRAEWAAYPGGVLFELGSHLIDAIVRLLGRPERVTAFLKAHGSFPDQMADNNLAVFEYSRATAVIASSALQPNAGAHRAFEILGTRGSATVRPLEPPVVQLDLAEAAGPYRQGNQNVPQPEYRRYEGEFGELAAAVRGERSLSVSLEQELEVQETLVRACRPA